MLTMHTNTSPRRSYEYTYIFVLRVLSLEPCVDFNNVVLEKGTTHSNVIKEVYSEVLLGYN